MNIGYDATTALLDRTSRGNSQRMIIEALAHFHPHRRYMLYTTSMPKETNYLRALFNAPCVHIKTPHGLPLFRSGWRTGNGILRACHRHHVKVFHGIDGTLPSGIKKSGIKSVVTIQSLIYKHFPEYYGWTERRETESDALRACREADCIIATSECTKRDIMHFYDVDPSLIKVVHPGCEPSFQNVILDSEIDRVRSRFDLPSHYILSIGALDERHNLELTVRALQHIDDKDLRLIIVGHSTPYYKKVKKLAIELGVGHRFYRVPQAHAADLPILYHLAQATVYPNRYDPLGIPIIESLSCGTPAIGATGSGLEESGGEGCLYVDPDSVEQMTQAINAITGNPTRRAALAEAGSKHIAQFAPQAVADAMIEIYDQLLDS